MTVTASVVSRLLRGKGLGELLDRNLIQVRSSAAWRRETFKHKIDHKDRDVLVIFFAAENRHSDILRLLESAYKGCYVSESTVPVPARASVGTRFRTVPAVRISPRASSA